MNPLGSMFPDKILALMTMDVLSFAAIYWYLRGMKDIIWGRMARKETRLLIAGGVMVTAMIITMGFIREDARVPDLISGHMTIEQQNVQAPIPTPAPPSG
jgi:hypothetical protein